MLELIQTRASVVGAYAVPEALDSLVAPGRSVTCRVARDEVMFIAHPHDVGSVARQVSDRIGALDPEGLTMDVSDGWFSSTIVGDEALEAFGRFSELRAGRGFVQGKFAGVPAKLLVGNTRLHVMVASMYADHLLDRFASELPDAHRSTAEFDPGGWPG